MESGKPGAVVQTPAQDSKQTPGNQECCTNQLDWTNKAYQPMHSAFAVHTDRLPGFNQSLLFNVIGQCYSDYKRKPEYFGRQHLDPLPTDSTCGGRICF